MVANAGSARTKHAGSIASRCLVLSLGLVLLLGAVQAGHAADLSCSACLHIARTLESELIKMDRQHSKQPTGVDSNLIGNIGPRRRLIHARSELVIFKLLDELCDKVPWSREAAQSQVQPCKGLIQQYRDRLEEYIYSEGLEHMRRVLCTDLSHICPAHALYDSGEL